MVFGLLTAVVAAPAIAGTTEGIRYGQKNNQREEHRGKKYNLTVTLARRSRYSQQFDGAQIILKDNKFYVDTRLDSAQDYWPVTANYLAYPGRKELWRKAGYAGGEGFVTTINAHRFLNWVYVDSDTHEVKYGVRAEAEPHNVGPWDCTQVQRRLTFQGWEGFVAVQEEDDDELWALYFDCEDDGLTGKDRIGNKDRPMLEVEVWRREAKRDLDSAIEERAERLEEREARGLTVQ
ncbi:hypothetical protein KC343_g3757 [Hortaea werneckii]|uniref:Uncharacterized protein n=1 Tax=Hortaea werneckii TaxID=91943 RepID=A0A3M7GNT9_HORWE|nr:hypothetical protein KC352_g8969 [Hortaea werneckii]KAI7565592.1 hypothetical protein KC317_g6262 [Hortaea werneckii]KAI7623596.1 hypothetical protein KC346_g2664 [Hortaea werneckii]KAI7631896.1 hypothetical protein KC343_g3757 [Hortaea werneckii]KAI7715347.1 hypothetical protein KC322_g2956 [Hortaea werneckii]